MHARSSVSHGPFSCLPTLFVDYCLQTWSISKHIPLLTCTLLSLYPVPPPSSVRYQSLFYFLLLLQLSSQTLQILFAEFYTFMVKSIYMLSFPRVLLRDTEVLDPVAVSVQGAGFTRDRAITGLTCKDNNIHTFGQLRVTSQPNLLSMPMVGESRSIQRITMQGYAIIQRYPADLLIQTPVHLAVSRQL